MRKISTGRFLAALAVLTLSSLAPSAGAADGAIHLVRTYTGWRDAASFKRISEYFTGKENTGGEIIVRTHPERRDGYYFLVRAVNEGASVAARIVIRVITPNSAVPRTFTFNTPLPGGTSLVDVGITGEDWPAQKINAVAWQLEMLDETGRVLATEKSYLWEKPDGK
jgi:hypothetical protein